MPRLAILIAALFLTAVLAQPVQPILAGGDQVWDGGSSTDSDWMTAANWVGDVITGGDHLIFPGGAARTNNNNNFPAGNYHIAFAGTGSGYTLNGNGIVLKSTLDSEANSGVHNVNLPITLTANSTATIEGPSEVRLNSTLTGTAGLTKTGSGKLVLSGSSPIYS